MSWTPPHRFLSVVAAFPDPCIQRPALDFGQLRALVAGYLRPEDLGRIEAAYHFAADAHTGQLRKSGEPYISHPVAVAEILAGWHLDSQALCAALLMT
jgi:guanosine-3',5'-bis(diphosphate) 3'-pyrophosphohydrolase